MTESYEKRLIELGEELKKIVEKRQPIDPISEDWSFLCRLAGYIEGLKAYKKKEQEGPQC